MKTLVVTLLTVAVVFAAKDSLENDDIIKAVNNAKTTWTAGRNFNSALTKDYAKKLLGRLKREGGSILPLKSRENSDFDESAIPDSFDSRTQWSYCDAMKTVRDQGDCGSCWAVGAAAAFTDRYCVATKGSFNSQLAAEEVLACCSSCGYGCDGGYDDEAWQYFQDNGLVTGGDYKSKQGCQPYKLKACEHHVEGSRPQCSSLGNPPTPKCKKRCYNKKYKTPFTKDHHKTKSSFSMNECTVIQNEILTNGPVEAGFEVYEDFLSYKTGVYQRTTGDLLGGHAVKVLGWGVENDTPFWLVANSWNSDWGDKGFFKIKRGSNECDFEGDMSAGLPDV